MWLVLKFLFSYFYCFTHTHKMIKLIFGKDFIHSYLKLNLRIMCMNNQFQKKLLHNGCEIKNQFIYQIIQPDTIPVPIYILSFNIVLFYYFVYAVLIKKIISIFI